MSVVLPAMNINGKKMKITLLCDTDTVTQVHDASRLIAEG